MLCSSRHNQYNDIVRLRRNDFQCIECHAVLCIKYVPAVYYVQQYITLVHQQSTIKHGCPGIDFRSMYLHDYRPLRGAFVNDAQRYQHSTVGLRGHCQRNLHRRYNVRRINHSGSWNSWNTWKALIVSRLRGEDHTPAILHSSPDWCVTKAVVIIRYHHIISKGFLRIFYSVYKSE